MLPRAEGRVLRQGAGVAEARVIGGKLRRTTTSEGHPLCSGMARFKLLKFITFQEQTEYKHEAYPWQEGEAQYNGECYECGNVLVYVGVRGHSSKDNYGFTHYIWGYLGAITGYVSQYDVVNPGANHTIWGWFAT